MTLDEIRAAVAEIEALKGDDEAAHSLEDALHVDFIHHVADVAGGELSEMAREVLRTEKIDFARWCA